MYNVRTCNIRQYVLLCQSVCVTVHVHVCYALTSLLDILRHSFHVSLCDLVDADGLGVRERGQDAGQQPHPLVPVPTRQTENLMHLLRALRGKKQL